jgi:hypothetical protein
MDRMLVVIFNNESNAYEGQKALLQLDREGSIGLDAYAVDLKAGGRQGTIKQGADSGPLGTLLGTTSEVSSEFSEDPPDWPSERPLARRAGAFSTSTTCASGRTSSTTSAGR